MQRLIFSPGGKITLRAGCKNAVSNGPFDCPMAPNDFGGDTLSIIQDFYIIFFLQWFKGKFRVEKKAENLRLEMAQIIGRALKILP